MDFSKIYQTFQRNIYQLLKLMRKIHQKKTQHKQKQNLPSFSKIGNIIIVRQDKGREVFIKGNPKDHEKCFIFIIGSHQKN